MDCIITISDMESFDSIFTRLDLVGGWPPEYDYLLQRRTTETELECKFSNRQVYSNGWSVACHRDVYAWWGLKDNWKTEYKTRFPPQQS